jgi:biopolymer transport protein ExbD
MAMNVNGGGGGYESEINVTPLVDVVLVLLIIFMMIVPVMMRGYDVDVPGETVAVPYDEDRVEQIVMTIDLSACPIVEPVPDGGLPADCTVNLNDEAVAMTDLATRIGETFADREGEDRVLFLAAADRLNYEGVMRILDVAKSGTDDLRIGLVTEQ